jgi:hypothetical protein
VSVCERVRTCVSLRAFEWRVKVVRGSENSEANEESEESEEGEENSLSL